MKLQPGHKLGPYEIIAPIGKGGMGEVYRARDTRLKRDVAIKVLPNSTARDPEALLRFRREAEAVAALSHPNILAVYDIGAESVTTYIVTELLEGETLRERLRQAPLSWRKAVEFAVGIAEGLAAAHARGIVHRDLKPENVFITTDGVVKLLDFGLARRETATRETPFAPDSPTLTAATKPGALMGTVSYMSPEQLRGELVDARSDIFGFGCVLYEMLTSRPAFVRATPADTITAILAEEPMHASSVSPGITPEVNRVLTRCLEKKADERFQSARDLAFALRAILSDSGSSRRGPAVSPPGGFRRYVIGSGALLVVGVFALAYLVPGVSTSSRPPSPPSDAPKPMRLAVLPFENLSDDPEQGYFCDGMTEEMITVLGRMRPEALKVIARSSAMRFKESDDTVQTIAKALNVGYVVEGSVLRQGDRVRISAKLIDADDATQIWARSFNGTLDDIFALQSDVANEIGKALSVTLVPGSDAANREHIPDPRAYEEYLLGRFWDHEGTEVGWRKAIAHYENAVDIDPDYALAHASLSQSCSTLASWTTVSPTEPLRRAKAAMETAFELNPALPDAHVAQAYYYLLGEWEWEKADEAFQRALAMGPINPGMTYHWYGHYLTFMGRDDEAIEAFKAALRNDPLSALHYACLGSAEIAKGDLDRAEWSIRRALELNAKLPVAYNWLGLLRERQGRLQEAVSAWEEGARCSGRNALLTGALGYGYGRIGRAAEARDVLEELRAGEGSAEGYVSELNLARVYAGLGNTDQAFEQLEIAYSKREPWILALKISAGFDTIRDDPRFADLLRRIGVEP